MLSKSPKSSSSSKRSIFLVARGAIGGGGGTRKGTGVLDGLAGAGRLNAEKGLGSGCMIGFNRAWDDGGLDGCCVG